VKEVNEWVEWSVDRAAITLILLALRLVVAGIGPPLAGALPGLWDHGVQQYQECDLSLVADQWRREAA